MEVTLSGYEVQCFLGVCVWMDGFGFGLVLFVFWGVVLGWCFFGLFFFYFLVVLHRYADWDLNVKNLTQSWAVLWFWPLRPPAKTQE